jgi:hypothetical protein
MGNQSKVCTEEEAIKITIEHGYDGAEFKTSVWEQRGCLKPNGTLKTLLSKLKTIYEDVEVTGNGKKRRYIFTGKKEIVTQRILNYKGSVVTVQDETMKEYIFNKLLTQKGQMNLSYKSWARNLEFCNTDNLQIEELINSIKELHWDLPFIYNPKEVVSKFIHTLSLRSKDVIEKSFKRLVSEGRIQVEETYNFKRIDGSYEEVELIDFEEVQAYLRKFLESKDVTYYAYTQSLVSFHKSSKMKEIINEVAAYLESNFEIEYFYKSYKVTLLTNEGNNEVAFDEFNEAYFQRFITLTKQRQNNDKYNNSMSFWKRFYLLNTATLLKQIGIEGLDIIIQNEKKLKNKKVEDFHLDRMINHFESDIEKQQKRKSFG